MKVQLFLYEALSGFWKTINPPDLSNDQHVSQRWAYLKEMDTLPCKSLDP